VKRTILDLCGGTGAWSKHYVDAGYEVIVVDPQEWRGGEGSTGDVRLFQHLGRPVHGILAAPPCTHFSGSGARWWAAKGKGVLKDALSIVDACLRIVITHKPKWWALENPVGRLRSYIGDPRLIFDPCDYGDPYTKKTLLWGDFALPTMTPVEPTEGSKMHRLPPSPERALLRSATPAGFARAFFEANP
jgi:hypothetical protein